MIKHREFKMNIKIFFSLLASLAILHGGLIEVASREQQQPRSSLPEGNDIADLRVSSRSVNIGHPSRYKLQQQQQQSASRISKLLNEPVVNQKLQETSHNSTSTAINSTSSFQIGSGNNDFEPILLDSKIFHDLSGFLGLAASPLASVDSDYKILGSDKQLAAASQNGQDQQQQSRSFPNIRRESRRMGPLRSLNLFNKPKVSPLYLINGTVCRFVNSNPICTTLSTQGLLRK